MNNIDFKFLKGRIMDHPTRDIKLEYLERANAVCITLFSEKLDKVLLVEQFRPGANKNIFENVAGLIDDGENPDTAVYRELEEETGYKKNDITFFSKLETNYGDGIYTTPGSSTEKLYFYAAKLISDDVIPGETNFDFGEDIKSHWININEISKYELDLKTLFSIFYFLPVYKEIELYKELK